MPITKQTIAIVGADSNTGTAIAKNISGGNYRLLLLSKDQSKVQPLAKEIKQTHTSADVCTMDCKYDACWEADIIVMAIAYSKQEQVTDLIDEVSTQKIVIDMVEIEQEPPNLSIKKEEPSKLQKLLPNAKVVRVFSTDFSQPTIDGKRTKVYVTGGDDETLDMVTELIESAGFKPAVAVSK